MCFRMDLCRKLAVVPPPCVCMCVGILMCPQTADFIGGCAPSPLSTNGSIGLVFITPAFASSPNDDVVYG